MMVEVERGRTLIARGWVKIGGEFEILGWRNDGAEEVEINADRFVPIYAVSDCTVMLDNRDYMIVDGKTIPESWERLANRVEGKVVFIYGGVDCGKSALATYLINRAGGWVLDLDIGQSDIAHPGAMGYGHSEGKITSLSEIEMENGFFVGCISPTGREAKCLRGVERLWREVKNREGSKVVDTTGWIRGKKAREYKLAKIEIIQPDIIAAFNKAEFIDDFEVFNVEKGFVVEKSRDERMRARRNLYRKWTENSRVIELPVKQIRTESTLFSGEYMPSEFIQDVVGKKVLFVKKGEDFLNVCVLDEVKVDPSITRALKELYEVEDLTIFSLEDLKGLVVGLYWGKKYLGMGLLEDVREDSIILRTSVEHEVDRVEFGEVKFDGEKEYIVRVP